jgi:hypothetical protein
VQTLVYLALFGRRDRAPQTKPGKGSNDAPALLLDSYADLGSGPPSRGIGSVAASVCGGLAGGAAFCVLVAAVHSVVHPPLLRGCLYLLWLLFVAFPLGATLGSVTGRAVWLRCRREEAAARTVAGRGGTGIAVGMAVAIPVAVVYAVASCGGDPDCVRWYLSLELPIFLLALVWAVALRSWSGGGSGQTAP